MKTNKAILLISGMLVASSMVSTMSFAAVIQDTAPTLVASNAQNAAELKTESVVNAPIEGQSTLASVAPKLQQARKNHHVTPQNFDCAFSGIVD